MPLHTKVIPNVSKAICTIVGCPEETVSETLASGLGTTTQAVHIALLAPFLVPPTTNLARPIVELELSNARREGTFDQTVRDLPRVIANIYSPFSLLRGR